MKRVPLLLLLVAVPAVAAIASMSLAYGQAGGKAAEVYVTKMPAGYRNWRFISTAHEAGNFNSIGALLGNDVAYKAISTGKLPYPAILDASVSRLRPVLLVAVTTVLGMIPLLQDPFFVAMAATIMFGLAFACVLTMIVVPVLYAIAFRIQ